ncbi:MAG: hypothetical protein F7B95_02310 [Desulfurococcales archaeon]|nr:hypothetical protein [Desulfurococcales archaeon]
MSIELREYSQVHSHNYTVVMADLRGNLLDHVGHGSYDAESLARNSADLIKLLDSEASSIIGSPLEVEIIGTNGTIKILVERELLKILVMG